MTKIKISLPSDGATRPEIENIYPEINTGKYATKSIENQKIYASADILIDGHDIVSGRLLYKH